MSSNSDGDSSPYDFEWYDQLPTRAKEVLQFAKRDYNSREICFYYILQCRSRDEDKLLEFIQELDNKIGYFITIDDRNS